MPQRLVQITDCHLMADPLAELKGIRTRARFEQVCRALHQEITATEFLVVTGDLTHDERAESYEALRDALSEWATRLRVIPGNHDDRRMLQEVLEPRARPLADRVVFVEDLPQWRLIGLDSHVPGEVHGELGDRQVSWLNDRLDEAADRFVLLFVHHPPVSVGSPWLDRIDLRDAEALWLSLHDRPNVRAILAGHVHQECTRTRQSATVFTSPATGVQFVPESDILVVDQTSPGYRVIELSDDGSYRTRVVRVPVAD